MTRGFKAGETVVATTEMPAATIQTLAATAHMQDGSGSGEACGNDGAQRNDKYLLAKMIASAEQIVVLMELAETMTVMTEAKETARQ